MELLSEYWFWIGLAAALVWLVFRRRPTDHARPGPSAADSEPSVESPDSGRLGLETAPFRPPLEDSLDLHTFSPRDVVSVADEYLREACRAGLTEVRLIHGKGSGFQRDRIRNLLSTHPLVSRYGDAPPERGGWGATLVWLACGGEKGQPRNDPANGRAQRPDDG